MTDGTAAPRHEESERILALDLGSSSVRAVVCDGRGEPVPDLLARRGITPRQAPDGTGELDPEVYLSSLIACLDELFEKGALDGVTGVATACQWHSALAIDPEIGHPRGFALSWLDTRADPERKPDDPVAFHRRTGAWVHSLYWTAKIPWLRRHRKIDEKRYLGLPDYIRLSLLGDDSTSISMASGTGMLDVETCDWDAEALEIAGVGRDDIPPISDKPGRLVDPWRRRWPPLADVPWYPVVGDGAASNFGSGCGGPGTLAVTVGTSMALRVVHTESAELPWEIWRYRVDRERYVSGVAFSAGGVLHAWVTRLLKLDEDSSPKKRPGESGLVVVPMQAGSRPPGELPPGSGAVVGLGLETTADDFLAGTMEGVCLAAARALRQLEHMVGGTRFDVALGGGAAHASPWWQEAFAAAIGRRIRIVEEAEVGARGAAAVALGRTPPPPEQVVEPDRADVERMAALHHRYLELSSFLDTFQVG